MKTQEKPVCVFCSELWNSYELQKELGHSGVHVSMRYIKKIIDEKASQLTGEILEFKESLSELSEIREIGKQKQIASMEKGKQCRILQREIRDVENALIPEFSLKRKRDMGIKESFEDLYNSAPYADFELYYFKRYTHGIDTSDQYGRIMALLNLEQEAVQMAIAEDAPTMWALKDSNVLCYLRNSIAQYPWCAYWNEVQYSYSRPARRIEKKKVAACPECGTERPRGEWISRCTSRCLCGFIPGVIFYTMDLGCTSTCSLKHSSAAWSLYRCSTDELHDKDKDFTKLAELKNKLKDLDEGHSKMLQDMNAQMDILKSSIRNRQEIFYAGQSEFIGRPFFEIICCTRTACNGMVDLKADRCCCLCKTQHCEMCWTVHEGECQQSDIHTVETMKSKARQCPTCRAIIERSSGCPTMYCTKCKRGWNYDTGTLVHGIVENPHFWQDGSSLTMLQNTSTMWDTVQISTVQLDKIEKMYPTIGRPQTLDEPGRFIQFHMGTLGQKVFAPSQKRGLITLIGQARAAIYERFLNHMLTGTKPTSGPGPLTNTLYEMHRAESFIREVEKWAKKFLEINVEMSKERSGPGTIASRHATCLGDAMTSLYRFPEFSMGTFDLPLAHDTMRNCHIIKL